MAETGGGDRGRGGDRGQRRRRGIGSQRSRGSSRAARGTRGRGRRQDEEERAAHQMNASLQKEQIEVQQNLSWATTIVRTNCF